MALLGVTIEVTEIKVAIVMKETGHFKVDVIKWTQWEIIRFVASVQAYSTRLEKLHTFCEFLAEFLRVNNQTSQKTCIKPYVFTYLAFNVQKTHSNSNIFLNFSQIIAHRNLHTVKKGTSEIHV